MTWRLPDGFTYDATPAAVEIVEGPLTYLFEVEDGGESLRTRRTTRLSVARVSPAEYSAFTAALRRVDTAEALHIAASRRTVPPAQP